MKISTFLLSALLLAGLQSMSFAQTNKSFNYQAVVRKATGDLVQKTDVSVKFFILNDIGTVLYSEKQDATTDAYGVLNLSVGEGSKLTGTFETITWDGDMKLKVEVDYDKNGTADLTGMTPIAKVPSAYYSAKAGLANKADGLTYDLAKVATSGDYSDLKNTPAEQTLSFDKTTNVLSISKGNTVDLSKLSDGLQNLSLSGTLLSIGGGNTVDLSNAFSDSDSQTLSLTGNTLKISNGNSVILPAGSGTGDMVAATYDTNNNGKVDVAENSEKIGGIAVTGGSSTLTNGQVLTYNGTAWAPAAAPSGLPSLTTAGSVLTVNATGAAAEWKAPVTMSGDISVNTSGVVTVDKIKNTGISATAPTTGQVLTYNGSVWAPANTNAATTTTVEDLLTSTSTTNALSANQGKTLNDAIATNTAAIANKADKSITVNGQPLSANVTLTKSDVGLSNVENTADANKPVSTATQTALDLKAPLASPALTGIPTAPTAAPATNDTQIATTAFVTNAVTSAVASATIADADATTKGKIQLAGDLGGSADAPTVPGLLNKVDNTITVNGKPLSANVSLTKSDMGLDQVDNTSDLNKPISNAVNLALQNKATVSGDLGGTGPITTVTGIQGTPVSATAPTSNGQVLTYNLSLNQWEAAAAGGVPNADATSLGAIKLAGDLAGTGSTATAPVITDKAVTYAKMQDVAATSLIGNSATSAGVAQEIALGDGLSFDPSGKLSAKYVKIKDVTTSTYTILDTDYFILLPDNIGAVTLHFPVSNASTKGRIVYIINMSYSTGVTWGDNYVAAQTGSVPPLAGGMAIDTGSGWLMMNGQ